MNHLGQGRGLTARQAKAPFVHTLMLFGPSRLIRPRPLTWSGILFHALLWLAAACPLLHGADWRWRWHWSNPLPHGNNITDFAYHTNHHFIQVTDHGQVYASDALDHWESRETGTRQDLRGATFLRDRLVISGERGLVLWSDDIQRFQQVNLGTEDWLEGVAASPVRAVAVGDNAAIYLSDDGLEWTRQPVAFTNWLRGVAWGEGVFVAVGEGGLIATSPDGIEWTPRGVSEGNPANLNRVTWTGSGFVIAGDAFQGASTVIFGNSSGTSWVRQTQSSATGDLFASAAQSPSSKLVAGDREVRLASGSSVIFWSDQTTPPGGAPPATYWAAISDGQYYVLGGQTGRTVTGFRASPDPDRTDWAPFPSPPRQWLFDVTTATAKSTYATPDPKGESFDPIFTRVTNHLYVAVGDLGTLLTSETGAAWSAALPPLSVSNQVYLAVAGNAHGLVAAGSAGTLSFSPSAPVPVFTTNVFTLGFGETTNIVFTSQVSGLGRDWYEATSPTNLDFLSACASPNLFVIGGQSGFMATSTDGTHWTEQVSGTTNAISGLEFWNNRFIAVGDEGTLLTSPDAVTWTAQSSGTSNWLFRVRGNATQLVAVGRHGTILTSPDAMTWTARDSGVTNALNDVRFAVHSWFVAGNQGTLLHSPEGVNWIRDQEMITGKSLYGLATRDEQLVTVGIEGIILRTRLTPYLNPVEFVQFPQSPGPQVFIFQGEFDQRFRLDQGASLNRLQLGPILTITGFDGQLTYTNRTSDDLWSQIFLTHTEP